MLRRFIGVLPGLFVAPNMIQQQPNVKGLLGDQPCCVGDGFALPRTRLPDLEAFCFVLMALPGFAAWADLADLAVGACSVAACLEPTGVTPTELDPAWADRVDAAPVPTDARAV